MLHLTFGFAPARSPEDTILSQEVGARPKQELVNDTNSLHRGQVVRKAAQGSAFAAVRALRAFNDANSSRADSPILPTEPVGKPSGRLRPKILQK
mmetsp:Transcript_80907/g.262280  ORF Transcript_80907/g.262280 Transcript_80907/m.262280 type:complete len:95 (-) Transcript_80907:128-412(-)